MARVIADPDGWEELARLDPLWAVASSPHLRHGAWDEQAFYAGGERKVAKLMKRLDKLGVPRHRGRALDFGCGAGRLSLPLADRFGAVVGVDIAPSMLVLARERAAARGNVDFRLDGTGDQSLLAGEAFDLVYSGLVLQHLPSTAAAVACLERLCAAVGPGGVMVVQVPVKLPLRSRAQLGQRAYKLLRHAGVPAATLYRRTGLHPMTMTCIPRERFEATVTAAGLEIRHAEQRAREGVVSVTLYAARA